MTDLIGDANNLVRLTGRLVELNWTKEKPIVPGWYWWKGDESSWTVDIVFVMDGGDGFSTAYGDVDIIAGEWSGPIPQPSDAPAHAYYKAEDVDGVLNAVIKYLDQHPCPRGRCTDRERLLAALRKEQ